jgi:hypothetical protein
MLDLGEPGADRAEVVQPAGAGHAGQDRPCNGGAGAGAGEPPADEDVGGGQVADLQPVAAALAGLVGRGQPFEDDYLQGPGAWEACERRSGAMDVERRSAAVPGAFTGRRGRPRVFGGGQYLASSLNILPGSAGRW